MGIESSTFDACQPTRWLPVIAPFAKPGGNMEPNPQPTLGQPYSNITPPQTSGAAIVSLVLGCAAFITVGFTAIPAVVFGHIALHRIGKSAGRLTGSGMAVAGLILGYLF